MASSSKFLIACLTLNILFGLLGCTGSPIWLEGISKNDLHTSKVTNPQLINYMQFKHWMHEKPDEDILEEVIARWDLTTNEVAIVTSMRAPSSRVYVGCREIVLLLSQDKPTSINRTQTTYGTSIQYVFEWDGPAPSPSHKTFYVYVDDEKVTAIQD